VTTAVRPAGLLGQPLTARELQALRGAANGMSNAEIAAELWLAENTIKSHLQRVFRKLGARDRAHAVALALQQGVLTLRDIQPTNETTVAPQTPSGAVQRVRTLLADWRHAGPPPRAHLIAHWWDHKLTQLATAIADNLEPTP